MTLLTSPTSTSTPEGQVVKKSSVQSSSVFPIQGGGSSAVRTTNGRQTQGYAKFLEEKRFNGVPISLPGQPILLPGLDAFRQKKYNIFGE